MAVSAMIGGAAIVGLDLTGCEKPVMFSIPRPYPLLTAFVFDTKSALLPPGYYRLAAERPYPFSKVEYDVSGLNGGGRVDANLRGKSSLYRCIKI